MSRWVKAPFGATGGRVLRIPIFVKFSSLSSSLIVLVAWGISFPILENQKDRVTDQLLSSGARMARIVAGNAADKILNDERLSLYQLVFDAAEDEQVQRAVITDRDGIVRADSLVRDIQTTFQPPPRTHFLGEDRGVTIRSFTVAGVRSLLFEKPVRFQDMDVGTVFLFFSEASILRSIREAKIHILLITCLIVILSMPLNLWFSVYFSRPIKALKESARAVGEGRFDRRVKINRNDTLGDLGEAFNRMASDLALKERIQDSFGRYVAPEVVNLVLQEPDQLWMKPTRVHVSVLFVDIRGFTRMAEDLAPERVVELLNAHFSRVTDIVLRNGGHLNKFIGDEAMAIFGVPRPDPAHAEKALRTALEIQGSDAACTADGAPEHRFFTGIGLNSGLVVAGNLGSPRRMEYTVIGDPVNIASRLTSLAGPGEVVVSGATVERLPDPGCFPLVDGGMIRVRGRQQEIRVYRLSPGSMAQGVAQGSARRREG